MVDQDNDAGWRLIAQQEPFWGVLSHDRFRRKNLDDASLKEFYQSGDDDIALTRLRVSQFLGPFPAVERALDFGCGVGRLAFAMARHAEQVIGYDVAPGMLDIAEKSAPPNVRFERALPLGPFDWINSQIVFQHIPPDRGMALLDRLLNQLGPAGIISLQFTLFREGGVRPRPEERFVDMLRRIRRSLGTRPLRELIAMFDYDLSAIFVCLNKHGVTDIGLFHTHHGIHHGALIVGRKNTAAI